METGGIYILQITSEKILGNTLDLSKSTAKVILSDSNKQQERNNELMIKK